MRGAQAHSGWPLILALIALPLKRFMRWVRGNVAQLDARLRSGGSGGRSDTSSTTTIVTVLIRTTPDATHALAQSNPVG